MITAFVVVALLSGGALMGAIIWLDRPRQPVRPTIRCPECWGCGFMVASADYCPQCNGGGRLEDS